MSKLAYIAAAMPGLGMMISSWGENIVYEKQMCTGLPCDAILIGYLMVFIGVIAWVADLKFNTSSDEFRKTFVVSFAIFILVSLLAIGMV
ncbi:hypothetical protein [Thermococcus sp.]